MLSDSHLSSQLAYTGVRCGLLPGQMLPPHHLRACGHRHFPRDHLRLLGLTHAWQHPALAVMPGVETEPGVAVLSAN